jgi:hypothetical protein
MANRQDSGSTSAHQNQRPTDHNEDAIPEMTEETRDNTVRDETRGAADEADEDEFEDTEDLDDEDAEDEEGSF